MLICSAQNLAKASISCQEVVLWWLLSYRTWPTFWNFGEKGATEQQWPRISPSETWRTRPSHGELWHHRLTWKDAWMLWDSPWVFGSTSTEYVHDYLGNTMWKPNKNLPQHTEKFLDFWITGSFCGWSRVGLRDQYLKRGQICTGHTVAPATWIQIWRHAAPGAQFPRFTTADDKTHRNLRFTVQFLKLCHSERHVLPYLRYALARVTRTLWNYNSIQPKLPR